MHAAQTACLPNLRNARRAPSPEPVVRPRPPLFRALGADDPPAEIMVGGEAFHQTQILKHDSWAATAIYQSVKGRIVCKFNRRQSLFGLPMAWLGRLLARREAQFLALLADLPQVPNGCGLVRVDGKILDHAVAHDFVPGHPLYRCEAVSEDFFPRLQDLVAEMHRRRMAYVDLHKRENILGGDDGRPHLIDFQIGFFLSRRWPADTALGEMLLRLLQRSDQYHLAKHIYFNRVGPAVPVPPGDVPQPWWVKAHRMIAVPFRRLRRGLLAALGIRDGRGRATSEYFAEDAVRREMNHKEETK